jgi:hypothetical protein
MYCATVEKMATIYSNIQNSSCGRIPCALDTQKIKTYSLCLGVSCGSFASLFILKEQDGYSPSE